MNLTEQLEKLQFRSPTNQHVYTTEFTVAIVVTGRDLLQNENISAFKDLLICKAKRARETFLINMDKFIEEIKEIK